MRRISSGNARKGMTRSQARSHTCSAAVRVLLSVQAAASSSSTYLAGLVGIGGCVDAPQLAGAGPAFSPGEVAQALTDEVDDAGLVDRLRKDGVDRLRKPGEAV